MSIQVLFCTCGGVLADRLDFGALKAFARDVQGVREIITTDAACTKAVQDLGIANAMLHARHKQPQTTMRYFDAASASQLHTATALSDATAPARPLEPRSAPSNVPSPRGHDIASRADD